MERTEPNGVGSERRLDIGDPVVQRAAHTPAMGIWHEHEATDTGVQQALNELLRGRVVEWMPEVRPEIGPNGLEEPCGHQVSMDIDDRVGRRQFPLRFSSQGCYDRR